MLVGGETAEVVIVDPVARRVLHREPLPGVALGAVRAGNRLLTLLAPRGRIGTAQLVSIEADGRVRTAALDGISVGFAPPAAAGAAGRQASPGLAANGSRAVVVGVDRLAEVQLETMAVTGRPLVSRTTQRAAKLVHGWHRSAVWLRGDTIAFWGSTMGPEGPGSIGVRLLNVATGTERMLDAFAMEAARAGSTLLTYGRDELVGYRLDATKRFTLLQGTDTGYVQTAGRWAYVGSGNSTRFAVIDVATGRVVGHVRTAKPTTIFVP